MKVIGLKKKATRWTLNGVSKLTKEMALKDAKKETLSVSSYVERVLVQAIDLRKKHQEIEAVNDIKGVANLISIIDSRIGGLEKVAANNEQVDE